MVSKRSTGEGGEKGKKGKKRKRDKEGGTFRVLEGLVFRTRQEVEAHLQEALKEGDNRDNGDNGDDEGDQADDKGEGDDKGDEEGGDKGGEKEEDKGGDSGVPGARMRPGNPPPRRRGSLCVASRERGAGGLIGGTGLIGLTHHQVT